LISALDELREENKLLKKELMKQKEIFSDFLLSPTSHRELKKSVRRS
jgi:hypothetical protein